MIQSRKIGMITAAALCIALAAAAVMIGFSLNGGGISGGEPEYAEKIFGTDIIGINILADESEWQKMLDNAVSEEFIAADVVVNGSVFRNVGIRPKGNSSLTQVAREGGGCRYSFRLQFDEYVKGQTCFGLESFVLNNMLGDNTYMKEYVSYGLMEQIGVDAPYFGYADISVNGKGFGFYLAVELYNDSYEERTFGTTAGMLYNVKSMDMGDDAGGIIGFPAGGRKTDTAAGENGFLPEAPDSPEIVPPADAVDSGPPGLSGAEQPLSPEAPADGRTAGGINGRGNSGGSLEYTDDNPSSYSAIFNNAVGKSSDSDQKKVVEALKALSEGRDLNRYFDTDQILRYLAAHTVVVNLDSYSSEMAQNYYIYENDGRITILPWDYNLAWGGFQNGSALSVINFPVDTPVSGTEISARPLIEKLFENPLYLEKYHGFLRELITGYFSGGKWEAKINELNSLISGYVKNDATAFCTYEEYVNALPAFITLGDLRTESVLGQLDGSVPSTAAGQAAEPGKLIPADGLDISLLGSMGNPDKNIIAGDNGGLPGNMPDSEVMKQAMQIIRESGGTVTDGIREKLAELGLTEEQIGELSAIRSGGQNGIPPDRDQSPVNDTGSELSGPDEPKEEKNDGYLITTGILTAVLLTAVIFISAYKRKY